MRSLPPDSSFGTCPAMVRWAAGPVLYIIRLQTSVSESGGVGNRQNQPNRQLVVGCCKQPSIMAQSQVIAQAYAPGAPTARNTGVSPARDGSFNIASLNLSGWQQTETHCTGTHRRLPSINTGRCPNDGAQPYLGAQSADGRNATSAGHGCCPDGAGGAALGDGGLHGDGVGGSGGREAGRS